MNCPKCKHKMRVCLATYGGCDCGDCDPESIRAEFVCERNTIELSGKYRCSQQPIPIDELSDFDSIERWIAEHYNLTNNENDTNQNSRSL